MFHYNYNKIFKLKDEQERKSVNLLLYENDIRQAADDYNAACGNAENKKHITVRIYADRLEFEIQSANPLQQKYLGIALRYFSQILVENYSFLPFCTKVNPRKLFVTA